MGNSSSSVSSSVSSSNDETQLLEDHSEVLNTTSFTLEDTSQHDWSVISESQVLDLRQQVEKQIVIRPYETQQWTSRVLGFSSQYSSSWSADNVIGESNTFPKYGKCTISSSMIF